ncbi:methenyltetrahydromethanopterin cyclohydrolase [Methylomarinovum caldicuralii]|uniref:Methenyltetrahydromethanopterin cyclohydrolase n=1 Tax=Methylomarinovum caldicuralii TaxID=438856 RepID=A0AAU9CBG2_9GAMM|nr:methenyltetrahydromethanopterin cyclohydrolase [Methylomarinovum caldicuralii]BCX81859.1 methenyltetrahydromethanopterin cyclohydrolase [Methylomarinovum caldicuralii]
MTEQIGVSINFTAKPLVESLVRDAALLRLKVERLDNGVTLVDAGIEADGGLEAGRRIAEICMGGMGTVTLAHSALTPGWPLRVHVHATDPVLSCLGSQYAGWSLSHGKGKEAFYALGSGPARSMCVKEALFKELDYKDKADATVLVLEVDKYPPLELLDKIAADCGIQPAGLTVIVTPTSSLAGGLQVVARVLEVAMHKAHELGFPLEHIVDGSGSAPVPPPAPDFITAMGRTNDAILFAGQVHLFVKGEDEAAEKLAHDLPSSTSRDYGKPFAQVFKEYEYDFFKVDPMLFSPASVMVTAIESGRSFRAGRLDEELLARSFGA